MDDFSEWQQNLKFTIMWKSRTEEMCAKEIFGGSGKESGVSKVDITENLCIAAAASPHDDPSLLHEFLQKAKLDKTNYHPHHLIEAAISRDNIKTYRWIHEEKFKVYSRSFIEDAIRAVDCGSMKVLRWIFIEENKKTDIEDEHFDIAASNGDVTVLKFLYEDVCKKSNHAWRMI